jgi:hypothetical protein
MIIRRTVVVTLAENAEEVADLLDCISEWLEGDESPPDHWEEAKRTEVYQDIKARLSVKTKRMLQKLTK